MNKPLFSQLFPPSIDGRIGEPIPGMREYFLGIQSIGIFQIAGISPQRIFTIFAGKNAKCITYPGLRHVAVHKRIKSNPGCRFKLEKGRE
jgi:hypothetical protein